MDLKLSPKAKAVAAFVVGLLGAIATYIQAAISDGTITGNEWSKIGIVAATWLISTGAVYRVPNTPEAGRPARLADRPPTR
jgi:hypothetical protein